MTDETIPAARPSITDAEYDAVIDVLDGHRLSMGDYTEKFERVWADYCGVEHAIAVSGGTAALHLALLAHDIGEGDRVIVPPITFGATIEAVCYTGATPVFCDIDPETYTLYPRAVEACMERVDVDAILPVHLYGHPADMAELTRVAGDVPVIEDAAQAHGAAQNGVRAGALGDAGCFSFYATKNATSAEGGMVTTDHYDIAERVRRLRVHGMTDRDTHAEVGYNYKMSELEAALGYEQVKRLPVMNDARRRISERLLTFAERLEWATPAHPAPGVEHAYFWAPIEVAPEHDGKRVWQELREAGLETRHRYTDPLYRQPAFEDAAEVEDCPTAEKVAGQVLGLPNYPDLPERDRVRIREVLRAYRP